MPGVPVEGQGEGEEEQGEVKELGAGPYKAELKTLFFHMVSALGRQFSYEKIWF